MTDTELIRSAVDGDLDAFGALVERYRHAVYSVALSVVGEFAAAEDVAQETFLSAYTRLGQLRDADRFPGWLRRIAVNAARMWLRGRRPEGAIPDAGLAAAEGAAGLESEVADALASLPEEKRRVAILCYLDGVSRREAARFFGVTESALRKRLHDTKRLLQKRIVRAAEKALQRHLLPGDFARRCICGCEAARKESGTMKGKKKRKKPEKKKDCGCGCLAESGKPRKTARKRTGKAKEE